MMDPPILHSEESPSSPSRTELENSAGPQPTNTREKETTLESVHLSLSSIPASSFDNPSDNDDGKKRGRADRRKGRDTTTTPTLVDEDYEEEMISLDPERLGRPQQFRDEMVLRRTPGARMYSSRMEAKNVRRTPGATDMHRSANLSRENLEGMGETSLLGFGLTLSTPIGTSKIPEQRWDSFSSSSGSSSPPLGKKEKEVPELVKEGKAARDQRKRGDHGEGGGGTSFVWSMEAASRDAFSPNTLRLTEDLDNLLDDGDDQNYSSRRDVFRTKNDEHDDARKSAESWTSPYIFRPDSAQGQRLRTNKTGSSRNRRTSGRRSRNSNSPSTNLIRQSVGPPSYAHARHPKPVRSKDTPFAAQGFVPGQGFHPGPGAVQDTTQNAPRLHNFGGAFGPPAKNRTQNIPNSTPGIPVPPNQAPFAGYQEYPVPPSGMGPPPPPPMYGAYSDAPLPHNPGIGIGFGAPMAHGFAAPSGMPPRSHEVSHSFMPYAPSQAPCTYPATQQPYWPHPQYEMPMPPGSIGWQGSSFATVRRQWSGEAMGQYHMITEGHSASPPNMFANRGWINSADIVVNPDIEREYDQPLDVNVIATESAAATQPQSEKQFDRAKTPVPKYEKTEKSKKQSKTIKVAPSVEHTGKTSKKKQEIHFGARVTHKANKKAQDGLGPTEPNEDESEDVRRSELADSSTTRALLKEFSREYKLKERSSFREAEEYARSKLKNESFPANAHWKIYLELADLAKRSNQFDEARALYRKVCELKPNASKGWLEYSKLEEECGHMRRCAKILKDGLSHCWFSDSLLTRAIKHEEETGNIDRARELLSRLKHVGIEKVWKAVLEGALLEARAGNHQMARRVLKYLMHHVKWYGPLYVEAYRLERDLGRPVAALEIVENGLAEIPRYGPLWFRCAFQICEAIDLAAKAFSMPRTTAMLQRATQRISRELVCKVHLEAAQIIERGILCMTKETGVDSYPSDSIKQCRHRLAMTAMCCQPNLCWKVWLAGGRLELCAGNFSIARDLCLRAHHIVPEKWRSTTLMECARLEEYVGDTELARALLLRGRFEMGSDWKIWLESVQLEVRNGQYLQAAELAKQSLEFHTGAGRLWASLVQLRYFQGGDAQYNTLKRALRAVPKSGEVWCEGGRIHLNPFSKLFDLEEARLHLSFATRFTPQYGDSFLETLRLDIIEKLILPVTSVLWEDLQDACQLQENGSQGENDMKRIATLVKMAFNRMREEGMPGLLEDPQTVAELELRCANADPNYGLLWFHCREQQTDTARAVLQRAKQLLVDDLKASAAYYVAAIFRRLAMVDTVRRRLIASPELNEDGITEHEWEARISACAAATPSLQDLLREDRADEPSTVLLESSVTGASFVTGIVELNQHKPLDGLSLVQKRKLLYGSDAPFS